MKVAFRNRKKEADAGAQAALLAEGCHHGCPDWDVLVLAEVGRDEVDVFSDLAANGAMATWTDHVAQASEARPHGIVVLDRTRSIGRSQLPSDEVAPADLDADLAAYLEERKPGTSQPRALRGERWMATALNRGDVVATVTGFHAPFAADKDFAKETQNQLTKREVYRQLSDWAAGRVADGEPVVLGMDGNNWGDWRDPGDVGPRSTTNHRSLHWRKRAEADLFGEELTFHGPEPRHGLRDTLRVAASGGTASSSHGGAATQGDGSRPFGATYWLTDASYRMDRIYVSPNIEVRSAGTCYGDLDGEVAALRGRGSRVWSSDHALIWADLDI